MTLPGRYLTEQGLAIPTVESLLYDLSVAQRGENGIHPLLNTDPDSPVGQLNGIFASHLREAWEVVGILFNAGNPDGAEGALLDHVCAITGTKRAAATPSKFVGKRKLIASLTATGQVPAGTVFSLEGDPTVRFVATETVKANGVAGDYPVSAECEKAGPVRAPATKLNQIATPVVGLNAISNPLYDAELGTDEDLDPALRLRRESELRATGAANPDAIRADLLAIEVDGVKPVLSCKVFWNDSDAFDLNGLPPHSLEPLIYDGISVDHTLDDTVAQTVFDSKPGGIQVIGNQVGIAVDDTGAKQSVRFSRPTIRELAFRATLAVDPDSYAGDAAVQEAFVNEFLAKFVLHPGQAVVCSAFVAAAMGVAGVVDCTGVQIAFHGDAFPGPGVNLALGAREVGTTEAAWVTIAT